VVAERSIYAGPYLDECTRLSPVRLIYAKPDPDTDTGTHSGPWQLAGRQADSDSDSDLVDEHSIVDPRPDSRRASPCPILHAD
jgi:poly(3-hydroxybutyrate) depolymerase